VSYKVVKLVLDRSRHAGSHLLMLVVLAEYADDGGLSYPAVSSLAKRCRTSVRNAGYLLKALHDSGELAIQPNAGPRGTNRYRIALGVLQQQPAEGVQLALGSAAGAALQPFAGEGLQSVSGEGVQAAAGAQPAAHAAGCRALLQFSAPAPATQRRLSLQPIADEPSGTVIEPPLNRQGKTRMRATSPKPDGVGEQVWNDFLALREAKRAPVTPTVVEQARREAAKAAMSLEEFLQVWCARGSQGLQADWLKTHERRDAPCAGPRGKADALLARNIAAAQRFLDGVEK
jgi:hypothetical protein